MEEDNNLVERIYERTIGKFLNHFDRHRIQGRIFFSGLIIAMQLSTITYALVLAITHGFDILDSLNELINKCVIK